MKKMMIGSSQEAWIKKFTDLTAQTEFEFQVLTSQDCFDLLNKLNNAIPNVLVLDERMHKGPVKRVLQAIQRNKKWDSLAVAVCIDSQNFDQYTEFADLVVKGRLHLLDLNLLSDQVEKTLVKALSFSTQNTTSEEYNVKFLSSGETLLRKGEPGECVYIVKQGELEARLPTESGSEALGRIVAGEFVGEMAYINGEPRSADVVALSSCELIQIPIEKLDLVLFQKPAWSKALMKTLTKRIKNSNAQKIKKSA